MEGSRGDAPCSRQSGDGSQDLHSAVNTQADSCSNGAVAVVWEWEDAGVASPDLPFNICGPAFVKLFGSVFIHHDDRGKRWVPVAYHH